MPAASRGTAGRRSVDPTSGRHCRSIPELHLMDRRLEYDDVNS